MKLTIHNWTVSSVPKPITLHKIQILINGKVHQVSNLIRWHDLFELWVGGQCLSSVWTIKSIINNWLRNWSRRAPAPGGAKLNKYSLNTTASLGNLKNSYYQKSIELLAHLAIDLWDRWVWQTCNSRASPKVMILFSVVMKITWHEACHWGAKDNLLGTNFSLRHRDFVWRLPPKFRRG